MQKLDYGCCCCCVGGVGVWSRGGVRALLVVVVTSGDMMQCSTYAIWGRICIVVMRRLCNTPEEETVGFLCLGQELGN